MKQYINQRIKFTFERTVTRTIKENILNASENTKLFELKYNLQNHEVCSHQYFEILTAW